MDEGIVLGARAEAVPPAPLTVIQGADIEQGDDQAGHGLARDRLDLRVVVVLAAERAAAVALKERQQAQVDRRGLPRAVPAPTRGDGVKEVKLAGHGSSLLDVAQGFAGELETDAKVSEALKAGYVRLKAANGRAVVGREAGCLVEIATPGAPVPAIPVRGGACG